MRACVRTCVRASLMVVVVRVVVVVVVVCCCSPCHCDAVGHLELLGFERYLCASASKALCCRLPVALIECTRVTVHMCRACCKRSSRLRAWAAVCASEGGMWARFMCNGRAVTAGHGLTCKASKLGARARAILVYVLSAAVHAWHRAWCLRVELGDSRQKTPRIA